MDPIRLMQCMCLIVTLNFNCSVIMEKFDRLVPAECYSGDVKAAAQGERQGNSGYSEKTTGMIPECFSWLSAWIFVSLK